MNDWNIRCDECKVYHGRHAASCSKITIEELRDKLKVEQEANAVFQKHCILHAERAWEWKGKWSLLKHENNVLRKKLNK